jgi:hypothetical protein
VEVYDQLFPFMQSQCSTLLIAAGLPGIMIQKAEIDPEKIAVSKAGNGGNDRNPDGGPKLTLL